MRVSLFGAQPLGCEEGRGCFADMTELRVRPRQGRPEGRPENKEGRNCFGLELWLGKGVDPGSGNCGI